VRITPDLLFLEITENSLHYSKREAEEQEEELIVPKKGLFLAFLGLFLQTKGGVEEQKLGNMVF
jgi:hypothetical protein